MYSGDVRTTSVEIPLPSRTTLQTYVPHPREQPDPGKHVLTTTGTYDPFSLRPNFMVTLSDGTRVEEWREGTMLHPMFANLQTFDKPTRVVYSFTKEGYPKVTSYWLQGPVQRPSASLRPRDLPPVEVNVRAKGKVSTKHFQKTNPLQKQTVIQKGETTKIYSKYKPSLSKKRLGPSDIEERDENVAWTVDKPVRKKQVLEKGEEVNMYLSYVNPANPRIILKDYVETNTERQFSPCLQYVVSQISGTCHVYSMLNTFLMTPPLRNYTLRVMHAMFQKKPELQRTILTTYAFDTFRQIVTSSVTRRVCAVDLGSTLSTAGVCLQTVLLGLRTGNEGGYTEVNFIAACSSIGLKGVLNVIDPRDIPADVMYMMQFLNGDSKKAIFDSARGEMLKLLLQEGRLGEFVLTGAFLSFDIEEGVEGHVMYCHICEKGVMIIYDTDGNKVYNCNWLDYDSIVRALAPKYRIGGKRIDLVLLLFRRSFVREQNVPVRCGDLDDAIDAPDLLSPRDIRALRRGYESFYVKFFVENDLLTVPLHTSSYIYVEKEHVE